jgi:predicted O-methyltransferase YrrM
MWFPNDGSEEWLNKADAELAIKILSAKIGESSVCEIGVWKGAWTSVILKNIPNSKVIGIDPYPNCGSEKITMLNRIKKLGLESKFSLVEQIIDLPVSVKFDLVHLDGLHTEEQVTSDLELISKRLFKDGIIVVDDFVSPWFPGVQSALYRFIHNSDYRIFLVSMQKAYVTRNDNANRMWNTMKELNESLEYSQLWENWAEAYPAHRYVQKTDILGQPVLISSPV